MPYRVDFEALLTYEIGEPGIGVPAVLKSSGKTVVVSAKIDTGAACCLFERRHGEELGFEIESGLRQLFGTATGAFVGYGHEVTLCVGDFEFDTFVFFPGNDAIARNVLGRFGWLDRMMLGLVDYEGKLYLSRYGE